MTENEILGFDPSQLSIYNKDESPKTSGNPLVYKTRPADSISEDKVYRCTIKPIYNPFDFKKSVLEQQSYAMQDKDGWFTIVSSLTNNDTSCPVFKAWKKCHYAKKEENYNLWRQAAKVEDGGRSLFDKRFARYITVQIIEDQNQPDLVGKYMLWKVPASIWALIDSKQNPAPESKKAKIPVMDFLFGRSIELEVKPGPGKPGEERFARETTYSGELSDDVVSVTNPDGSPILNDEQQAVLDAYVEEASKIWKSKDPDARPAMIEALANDPNTIELKKIYTQVLEEIKKYCPNLFDVLGYKPLSEDLMKRVKNWIDTVLAGNDPLTVDNAPEAAATIETSEAKKEDTSTATAEVAPMASKPVETESTDDLPF